MGSVSLLPGGSGCIATRAVAAAMVRGLVDIFCGADGEKGSLELYKAQTWRMKTAPGHVPGPGWGFATQPPMVLP